MISRLPLFNADRRRKLGALLVVCIAHAGAFTVMGRNAPAPVDAAQPPAIEVRLFEPIVPPPPPPPPDLPPSPQAGGGAPAAPSRIHTPPEPPPEVPREVPAPVQQAPVPTLVVGTAPIASPTAGMGQGGVGTGTGTGVGAGSGPGRGVRVGPRNLREATNGELRRYHPTDAANRRVSGVVVVSCRIRADTRVDQCEVLSATPQGLGFDRAGVAAATDLYRFRPATLDGRLDERVRAVITLEFGPPMRAAG